MDNLIEQYKEKYGKKPDLEQLQKFYNEQNGLPEPTKQSRNRQYIRLLTMENDIHTF